MIKFMGPHTFQPSNANDNRKKWFTNPKSIANSYKVKCLFVCFFFFLDEKDVIFIGKIKNVIHRKP